MLLASRATRLAAQSNPLRPDVAAIDHDRIVAAADRWLTQVPKPLSATPCPRSPGTIHDYYSEAAVVVDPDAPPAATSLPAPFLPHRDAIFEFGMAVPALAAAYTLTSQERYAEHAVLWLRAMLLDPATRMTPNLNLGHVPLQQAVQAHSAASETQVQTNATFGEAPKAALGGRYQGIVETVPLVEVAQAIPFLAPSPALNDAETRALREWFSAYLHWLSDPQDSGPRLGALARDSKDHHGTSWMLQASAYATLTAPDRTAPRSEDNALADLRHRYKATLLRAQISPLGSFPRELTSATPFRDSLFNLDMLALVCQLLSTRFESVWEYQLEDGPGMRSAIAYHFPFMEDRAHWPFRADVSHFSELPGRRVSLLLSARAYQRPEYATVWTRLQADPPSVDVLRSMPIHQPLLWVRPAPRT